MQMLAKDSKLYALGFLPKTDQFSLSRVDIFLVKNV